MSYYERSPKNIALAEERERVAKMPPLPTRTCVYCREPFVPPDRYTIWCSQKCRKLHNRKVRLDGLAVRGVHRHHRFIGGGASEPS